MYGELSGQREKTGDENVMPCQPTAPTPKAVISQPEARQQDCEAVSHTQAHNPIKCAVRARIFAVGKARHACFGGRSCRPLRGHAQILSNLRWLECCLYFTSTLS